MSTTMLIQRYLEQRPHHSAVPRMLIADLSCPLSTHHPRCVSCLLLTKQ
ncbi:mCG65172 [Mus musculus]|nr:mCG65172 [Mus musculus]